jgi:hypothetical protein
MTPSTRRRKRSQPTESLEEVSATKPKKAQKLITRISLRNINNCVEFGIPESLCCSSCQRYLNIEEHKRKNRCEYKHQTFQCSKPYKTDSQCHKQPRKNIVWLGKLDEWFKSQQINRISSLVEKEKMLAVKPNSNRLATNTTSTAMERTADSGCPPTINRPDRPLLLLHDNTAPHQELLEPAVQTQQSLVQPDLFEPIPQSQQKPRRRCAIEDQTVQVEGEDHIIRDVPKTHVVILQTYLKKLQNKASQIDKLHQSVRKKKYTGSPLSKRLLASALVSVPGLSLTGAELVIPLFVAAFLADSNLISDKLDLNLFSKSFASAHNLRDILISFAVDSLIEAGNEIRGAENVFLSCDKGNKKGLSHFVKILSWWEKSQRKVKTFVLDIDASEGTSEGCAEAIKHSMMKLNGTIALLLKGQTTDSGGGGVLESLAEQLKKRDICTPTYLVASCITTNATTN